MTTGDGVVDALPPELLILIIERVGSDEDLLRLASASRQLHNISIEALFTRHKVVPLDEDLRLSFSTPEAAIAVLSALATSLDVVGASLDSLTYDCGWVFDPKRLLKELHLLTRYVSKLASINQVTLRLAAPLPGWPRQWKDATEALLAAILSKSCSSIRINSSQMSSFHEQDVLSPWMAAIATKQSEWTKWYWPPPPETVQKDGKTSDLHTCAILTFPPFLRQFYLDTLKHNSDSLMDLTFMNIFGGGTDWDTLISNVSFPALQRLCVIYGVISRDVMVRFLVKHPTITSFEYHHIRYRTPTLKPVRYSFCEKLTDLTTSPEHILNFFPPPTKMRQLKNLTVKVDQSVRTAFHPLEDSFRRLAPFGGTLLLSLEISRPGLGFGIWFDAIPRLGTSFDPAARPESQLRCVEKLVVDNGDWGFTENFLRGLPAWLGLFPELTEVVLIQNSQRFMSSADPLEEEVLVKLARACPGLRSISVQGTIEWTHTFPRSS
ncbi:hypothetical protein NLJ89_g5546 [Agrocybe chaxingu]|uniref:F-box domain-containing protein n=1 Tax=Agrocybe chaxingu TaxID=84603 RepID=A0A9W8MVH7_9AGAR|nr:hypothetical protein NLJ89_g5546 [Agrocybe chaxingu]